MKKIILFLAAAFVAAHADAQTAADYAVQMSAKTLTNPTRLQINWKHDDPYTIGYQLFRRSAGQEANGWGTAIANLSADDSTYTDTVTLGHSYEYRILKSTTGGYQGQGYLYGGVAANAPDDQGRILLLIDKDHETALAMEIARLQKDLMAEGWRVKAMSVERTETVEDIKADIIAAHNESPLKAIFILGHVPVPYSGNFAIDGHPDHQGAWPADLFYADLDGNWTDAFVNNTSASRPANQNTPGDGKFDNDVMPGPSELWVGRVDMSDMPAFSLSETELLRRYLNKDHAWRTGQIAVEKRALVDEIFGAMNGEAFAASAYKSFAPMVGPENIVTGDVFTDMKKGSYLGVYGGGWGSYTEASGIGKTSNFASDSLQGVFAMFFGSYFGDWDSRNNFLRAPLASAGPFLFSAWSGRPQWYLHHMGLGKPAGYSAWVSQNDYSSYFRSMVSSNPEYRFATVSMMGDPTITMSPLAPVPQLTADKTGSGDVELTWAAVQDAGIQGYHVYRLQVDPFDWESPVGEWERVNTQMINGTTYTHSSPGSGSYVYMVRGVKLEESASGSYYNLTPGAMDTASVVAGISRKSQAPASVCVYPNPGKGTFYVALPSQMKGALTYTLTDMTGRTIEAKRLSATNGAFALDLSGQPAGVYQLRLQQDEWSGVARVVVK